ncbi:hypothetical protein PENTCL1PPCAC_9557, partial [Pristionchus entomophagus]
REQLPIAAGALGCSSGQADGRGCKRCESCGCCRRCTRPAITGAPSARQTLPHDRIGVQRTRPGGAQELHPVLGASLHESLAHSRIRPGASVRALGAATAPVQIRAQEVQTALRDAHAHHPIQDPRPHGQHRLHLPRVHRAEYPGGSRNEGGIRGAPAPARHHHCLFLLARRQEGRVDQS